MPNILASIETGKNSLITNQIGMDTTGHNIANVNTEDYSRQRVDIGTMYPDNIQPGQIGKGVLIQKIERIYNKFLEQTLRTERTALAEWKAVNDSQILVEAAFNEPSEFGMNNRTSEFFNSWQNLSEYPEDYGLRSLVVDSGVDLSNTYNQLKLDLNDLRIKTDAEVSSIVTRINEILDDVADLNKRILSVEVAGNQPNDLKDRRDRLTTELAEYIDITITEEVHGQKIEFGNYLLVQGYVTNKLGTQQNPLNKDFVDITFGGSVINFNNFVEGSKGKLGGLIDFRDNTVPSYEASLNEYAAYIAHNVNDEHYSGYSFNGTTTNLNFFNFSDSNYSDTQAHTARTGIIRIDAMNNIEAGSHHLVIGAVGTMTANANGNLTAATGSIALNQAGLYTGTTSGDYYVQVVGYAGAPVAGDLVGLQVQLMRSGTALSGVMTLGAGAGPTNVAFGTYDGITFDANITADAVNPFIATERSNGYDPDLTASLDGGAAINVVGSALYTFTGGANNGFTAGGTMDIVFGPSVTIGNDTITSYTVDSELGVLQQIQLDANNVAAASSANSAGDNSNLLDIIDLQFRTLIANDTQTFSQFYNEFMTNIGSDTKNAARWMDNQQVIVNQLFDQRESFSGVNLDEELTFLLKFQRGFESASRFVTTIDGMIDVIINRMGYVGR